MGRRPSVIEHRAAIKAELHAPDNAFGGSEQDVLGLMIRRGPAVRSRTTLAVVPGTDAERVAHDQPTGTGPPRGLQHQSAWEVPAAGRDSDVAWAEPETSSCAIEDCCIDAGAVRPRQAHPLDPAAWGDQAVDLTVGQKGVVGDRREGAHG